MGAETGRLPEMLMRAAEILQYRFDDTLKNLKTAPEIIGLLSISGFENSSTPEKILTAKNTRIAASASPNTPPRSLLICFTTGILNTLASFLTKIFIIIKIIIEIIKDAFFILTSHIEYNI